MAIDWNLSEDAFQELIDEVLDFELVHYDSANVMELIKKGFLVYVDDRHWSRYEVTDEFTKWLGSKIGAEVDAALNPNPLLCKHCASKIKERWLHCPECAARTDNQGTAEKDTEIRDLRERIDKLEGDLEAGRKVSANVRESSGDVPYQESGE